MQDCRDQLMQLFILSDGTVITVVIVIILTTSVSYFDLINFIKIKHSYFYYNNIHTVKSAVFIDNYFHDLLLIIIIT